MIILREAEIDTYDEKSGTTGDKGTSGDVLEVSKNASGKPSMGLPEML